MKDQIIHNLSRRERQIMDVIYRLGEASAADVHEAIPQPPSYSAVRALLGVLEEKGFIRHKKQGRAYIYRPVLSQSQARSSALKHVVQTFFDGSVANVVAALVNMSDKNLSDEDYERLEKAVKKKREQKRRK